jgi:hypothetical protein
MQLRGQYGTWLQDGKCLVKRFFALLGFALHEDAEPKFVLQEGEEKEQGGEERAPNHRPHGVERSLVL